MPNQMNQYFPIQMERSADSTINQDEQFVANENVVGSFQNSIPSNMVQENSNNNNEQSVKKIMRRQNNNVPNLQKPSHARKQQRDNDQEQSQTQEQQQKQQLDQNSQPETNKTQNAQLQTDNKEIEDSAEIEEKEKSYLLARARIFSENQLEQMEQQQQDEQQELEQQQQKEQEEQRQKQDTQLSSKQPQTQQQKTASSVSPLMSNKPKPSKAVIKKDDEISDDYKRDLVRRRPPPTVQTMSYSYYYDYSQPSEPNYYYAINQTANSNWRANYVPPHLTQFPQHHMQQQLDTNGNEMNNSQQAWSNANNNVANGTNRTYMARQPNNPSNRPPLVQTPQQFDRQQMEMMYGQRRRNTIDIAQMQQLQQQQQIQQQQQQQQMQQQQTQNDPNAQYHILEVVDQSGQAQPRNNPAFQTFLQRLLQTGPKLKWHNDKTVLAIYNSAKSAKQAMLATPELSDDPNFTLRPWKTQNQPIITTTATVSSPPLGGGQTAALLTTPPQPQRIQQKQGKKPQQPGKFKQKD